MKRLLRSFLMVITNAALAGLLMFHAVSARAGGDHDSPASSGVSSPPTERTAQIAAMPQGMRVYRDPVTGQLGPPPAGVVSPGLTISEQRMLSRSDQGLKSRMLPDGGVAIDLQGRFSNMSTATLGSNGQATVNCAITPAEASAALQAGQ